MIEAIPHDRSLELIPKRILFIRFSSLGDIILSEPVIRACRERYPNSTIEFATKEIYRDVLSRFTGLDFVYYLPTESKFSEIQKFRKRLKENKYDVVIDLHNSLRSRFVRMGLANITGVINKRTIKRMLMVRYKFNLLKNEPDAIGRYFEAANVLHLLDTSAAPRLEAIPARSSNVIAIAPGARHANKQWPPAYYATVAEQLIERGFDVVFLGSRDEKELCHEIILALDSAQAKNLAGKLTLEETIIKLEQCRLAITNDSGLMHLASSVGLPVIAFFGPTVKEFGFAPRSTSAVVLENEGLYCRPCTTKGLERCPEKHFRCMREILPEQALVAIENLNLLSPDGLRLAE